MRVWFTADTHFGHKKIPFYAKRKFCLNNEELEKLEFIWKNKNFSNDDSAPSWSSISKMNDHIIKKINEYVKKDDILWHLGDFCWSKKSKIADVAKKYREKINCKNIFLVLGNHDHSEIKKVFNDNYQIYDLKIGSKHIVLSHYSLAFWNKSHNKSWMLYGHAHGTAEEWLDKNMPGRLSMDVGIDNIFKLFGEYRPISFEEISDFFSQRSGYQVDGNKLTLQQKKNI
jgi:calcineurin-like phosphoesterase family protein